MVTIYLGTQLINHNDKKHFLLRCAAIWSNNFQRNDSNCCICSRWWNDGNYEQGYT